jgi:hypothetical protein
LVSVFAPLGESNLAAAIADLVLDLDLFPAYLLLLPLAHSSLNARYYTTLCAIRQ